MFISRAVGHRLCFVSILFVALFVRLSGNMKVFVDASPVSTKHSSSSSGAAPDVAPVSSMPILRSSMPILRSVRLLIFRSQCAATLLVGPMSVVAFIAQSTLVFVSSDSDFSSCSST
jgi:hypothetical protein